MKLYLNEIPSDNLPRERLLKLGANGLTDYELLAIILRTGTKDKSVIDVAKTVLVEAGHISNLNNMAINELMKIKGIGQTKAIELLATIELGRRINKPQTIKVQLHSTIDVFEYLRYDLQHLPQERFVAVYLNVKSEVIQTKTLSNGSINQTLIEPKDILRWALKLSSNFVIIAHNHPSGDPTPSPADKSVTKKLIDLASSMDIKIVDHIIIGHNRFYSFAQNGYK